MVLLCVFWRRLKSGIPSLVDKSYCGDGLILDLTEENIYCIHAV